MILFRGFNLLNTISLFRIIEYSFLTSKFEIDSTIILVEILISTLPRCSFLKFIGKTFLNPDITFPASKLVIALFSSFTNLTVFLTIDKSSSYLSG